MKRDTYLLAAAKDLDGFEGQSLDAWLNKKERILCSALYRKRGISPGRFGLSTARARLKRFARTGEVLPGVAVVKRARKRREINVNSAEFLASYGWRRARYSALKSHGGRCQCCGRGATDGVILHVDHIKPRRKFPDLALDANNLQVLCEECNHGKGNWDETDWRWSRQGHGYRLQDMPRSDIRSDGDIARNLETGSVRMVRAGWNIKGDG